MVGGWTLYVHIKVLYLVFGRVNIYLCLSPVSHQGIQWWSSWFHKLCLVLLIWKLVLYPSWSYLVCELTDIWGLLDRHLGRGRCFLCRAKVGAYEAGKVLVKITWPLCSLVFFRSDLSTWLACIKGQETLLQNLYVCSWMSLYMRSRTFFENFQEI